MSRLLLGPWVGLIMILSAQTAGAQSASDFYKRLSGGPFVSENPEQPLSLHYTLSGNQLRIEADIPCSVDTLTDGYNEAQTGEPLASRGAPLASCVPLEDQVYVVGYHQMVRLHKNYGDQRVTLEEVKPTKIVRHTVNPADASTRTEVTEEIVGPSDLSYSFKVYSRGQLVNAREYILHRAPEAGAMTATSQDTGGLL